MLPPSFATQMEMATSANENMNKLVLVKMAALEESVKGIRGLITDFKDLKSKKRAVKRESGRA